MRGPKLIGTIVRVLVSAGTFAAAGHVIANYAIESFRQKQVAELAQVIFRRNESAITNGAATLKEIAGAGSMTCNPVALQALRLKIYQRTRLKDLRLLERNGSVICSAYPETLEFDNGLVERRTLQPTRDAGLSLFSMEQINGSTIGLLRDIDDKLSLAAILGSNADTFDVIPAELRDYARVSLELANGATIGVYMTPRFAPPSEFISFTHSSPAFPLRATIDIDKDAYAAWQTEPYWPSIALAMLLGVAFGVLLAKASIKARGPTYEIDQGLRRNEFRPYYQPIFDLRSGRIVGCEALTRWVRRDGTVAPPMTFIPLAEASGQFETMTWQILATGLKELRPFMRSDRAFKASFNIVPRHLFNPDFIDRLRAIVADAEVSPRQIILEITERDPLPDLVAAAQVVAQLRDYGFRVAMDDVGVGHSGLSQLQGLGAQVIKIDKFFVDGIVRDNAAVAIVSMLVRLAQDLKMTVVAEGIETAEQTAALLQSGVEQGQGYVVAPPLPLSAFAGLIAERSRVTETAPRAASLVA